MGRLIDANLLTKQFMTRYTEQEKQGNFTFVACEIKSNFRSMMDEMPTVDAVPVVHGKWVDKMVRDWYCSVCNRKPPFFDGYCRDDKLIFCPNCGAKMDLERRKDV